MSEKKDTVTINTNLEITPGSIQAVVKNAKAVLESDPTGSRRGDTADLLSEMISKFLLENDFESFVNDLKNYPK